MRNTLTPIRRKPRKSHDAVRLRVRQSDYPLEEEKNNGKNSRSQRRQFNPEVEAF